jgi:hypothetical protein
VKAYATQSGDFVLKLGRFQVVTYASTSIYWMVRCNAVYFTDIQVFEVTLGVLGFGIVAQLPIHPPRMVG